MQQSQQHIPEGYKTQYKYYSDGQTVTATYRYTAPSTVPYYITNDGLCISGEALVSAFNSGNLEEIE